MPDFFRRRPDPSEGMVAIEGVELDDGELVVPGGFDVEAEDLPLHAAMAAEARAREAAALALEPEAPEEESYTGCSETVNCVRTARRAAAPPC